MKLFFFVLLIFSCLSIIFSILLIYFGNYENFIQFIYKKITFFDTSESEFLSKNYDRFEREKYIVDYYIFSPILWIIIGLGIAVEVNNFYFSLIFISTFFSIGLMLRTSYVNKKIQQSVVDNKVFIDSVITMFPYSSSISFILSKCGMFMKSFEYKNILLNSAYLLDQNERSFSESLYYMFNVPGLRSFAQLLINNKNENIFNQSMLIQLKDIQNKSNESIKNYLETSRILQLPIFIYRLILFISYIILTVVFVFDNSFLIINISPENTVLFILSLLFISVFSYSAEKYIQNVLGGING